MKWYFQRAIHPSGQLLGAGGAARGEEPTAPNNLLLPHLPRGPSHSASQTPKIPGITPSLIPVDGRGIQIQDGQPHLPRHSQDVIPGGALGMIPFIFLSKHRTLTSLWDSVTG